MMKLTDRLSLDSSVFDGFYRKNPLLVSGFIIAPVVACADTFANALLISFAFSTITFLTLMISTFTPRKIVYTVRVILYTLIAAVVYVPIHSVAVELFGDRVANLGFFFPLLVTNSMISLHSELMFYKMPKVKMIVSICFYIIGFDVAILVFAIIREFLTYGTIFDRVAYSGLTLDALKYAFGGFILLGIMAALYRKFLFFVSDHGHDASGSEKILEDEYDVVESLGSNDAEGNK